MKKTKTFENVPLSIQSVTSSHLELKSKVDSSDIFSLALDESCDVHNTGNCVP